jgi:hypothetical protein
MNLGYSFYDISRKKGCKYRKDKKRNKYALFWKKNDTKALGFHGTTCKYGARHYSKCGRGSQ